MITYRKGQPKDLEKIKQLALVSWGPYQNELTEENWKRLSGNLNSDATYLPLFDTSYCLVCENEKEQIVGMAFLVPSGNATDLFESDWAVIRFVSVHPDFGGQGIGKELTQRCIELAKHNNERTIALHTSEMMHKARHIYESLGFKILKEIEPRLGKRYWIYTLDLAS